MGSELRSSLSQRSFRISFPVFTCRLLLAYMLRSLVPFGCGLLLLICTTINLYLMGSGFPQGLASIAIAVAAVAIMGGLSWRPSPSFSPRQCIPASVGLGAIMRVHLLREGSNITSSWGRLLRRPIQRV